MKNTNKTLTFIAAFTRSISPRYGMNTHRKTTENQKKEEEK